MPGLNTLAEVFMANTQKNMEKNILCRLWLQDFLCSSVFSCCQNVLSLVLLYSLTRSHKMKSHFFGLSLIHLLLLLLLSSFSSQFLRFGDLALYFVITIFTVSILPLSLFFSSAVLPLCQALGTLQRGVDSFVSFLFFRRESHDSFTLLAQCRAAAVASPTDRPQPL